MQYAAQVGPLLDAGFDTIAFDYLGCGRSEKPNQCAAYAASELYADLQAVFKSYTEASNPIHTSMPSQHQQYDASVITLLCQ
jgi:pimeloyl-ACP methyl ester carboxylesterase